MSKADGQLEAIKLAVEKLTGTDLAERCRNLGLPGPESGEINFRAFGCDFILKTDDLTLLKSKDKSPAKDTDRIIVLHYLLCDLPVAETNELIKFRDFPGGQFYLEPFMSRSLKPLVKRFGDDLDSLKKNLDRFNWKPYAMGDLGAKIHTVGNLYAYLVYQASDEEFPAEAEMLFDTAFKRVFPAEDAVVIAGRICFGLF